VFGVECAYVCEPFIQFLYLMVSVAYCKVYHLKHEQQCFIRYKDTRRRRVSLGLITETPTANVSNCFENDQSSKFTGEVIFIKYVNCVSRENQS
jgi:hypothetical protein